MCIPLLKKVLIIGGGNYGCAIAQAISLKVSEILILELNKEIVKSINQIHQNIVVYPDIELNHNIRAINDYDSIDELDLAIIATPSEYLQNVCLKLKEHVNKNLPIIVLSKGILVDDNRTITTFEIARKYFNHTFFMAGASFASELINGVHTCVTLAGIECEQTKILAEQLSSNVLDISASTDGIGLSVVVALKNVLAIGCGILYGINSSMIGDNTIKAFISQGVSDIESISKQFGGASKIDKNALADVFLTCSNEQSRNMSFGKHLAKGKDIKSWERGLVEGLITTQNLKLFLEKNPTPYKTVFDLIIKVIHKEISVEDFIKCI